jgi:hypothetical protein
MAVTETATATEIGTAIVTAIRSVTVRIPEIGTGTGRRIETAGIATAMGGTRKGMSVAAGVPTASVAHPRHLLRRTTNLGPHAKAKILACLPPVWIKKSVVFLCFFACVLSQKKCPPFGPYLNLVVA